MSQYRKVYRAFPNSRDAALNDLYEYYRALYLHLPTMEWETETDRLFMEYVRQRRFFTLALPYTAKRELLLKEDRSDDRLAWEPLGGSLRKDSTETFIDAALRHAEAAYPGGRLGEVEPIAFLHNRFLHAGSVHEHFGIAFVARIRGAGPSADDLIQGGASLIPFDAQIELSQPHNAPLLEQVRHHLNGLDLENVPEAEVAANETHRHRYYFHERVVKPSLRRAGRFHFPHSVEDQEQAILKAAMDGPHRQILDVACGESSGLVSFTTLPDTELVVGNDVDWGMSKVLQGRLGEKRLSSSGALLMFTNHDARSLPFCDGAFDFVLCKNVLHHMEDAESARRLVDEVVRVGHRALIVEVMDPEEGGPWDRLLHRYYIEVLGDAGQGMLSRELFTALTNLPERMDRSEMRTIRGTYLFASFASSKSGGSCQHPMHVISQLPSPAV